MTPQSHSHHTRTGEGHATKSPSPQHSHAPVTASQPHPRHGGASHRSLASLTHTPRHTLPVCPHRHTPSSAVQARESREDWRPYYRPPRCERFRRHPSWFTSGSELTRFTGFPHPVLTHPQMSSNHPAKRENRAKTEWKPKIWSDRCPLGSVAPT